MRGLWIPPLAAEALGLEPDGQGMFRLDRESLAALCMWLRERRDLLLAMETSDVLGGIDLLTDAWLGGRGAERCRSAAAAIAAETGYAASLVERALQHVFGAHTRPHLERLLRESFHHPDCLDRFVPSAAGQSRAWGPELTLLLAAGNVPVAALPAAIQCLLLRSPCVARAASGETTALPALARSLWEVSPLLGSALAVLAWDREDEQTTRALAAEAEAVVAYGSDETLQRVRGLVLPSARFIGYGHRVGFGIIDRFALSTGGVEATALLAARDVAAFDQQGCMSAQWFFVEEGGENSPEGFAERLAAALARLAEAWPRRPLSPAEASAVHQTRGGFAVREGARVWASEGTEWTVILHPKAGPQPGCLNRLVFVMPVPDFVTGLPDLSALAGSLQTVTCAVRRDRKRQLATGLGRLGVTRICRLGQAQEPAAGYHHDGRSLLQELVRWTDIEGG